MYMAPSRQQKGEGSLYSLLYSLLAAVSFCSQEDIDCLKSIKDSLDDPYGYLQSSWDFNNQTEGFICRFTGVDCWHPDENKVLNIRLSDMGLKGEFPRGIHKCRSLTGLDLSNNELSGSIPTNISQILFYVTVLDLSSNRFSGNIPKSIANCSYLQVLNLNHNQLTGFIPRELAFLPRFKTLNVANNQLYGTVPSFPIYLSKDSFAGNPGLCGAPLESCNNGSSDFRDFFKKGLLIGYAISVVSVMTIFMFYCDFMKSGFCSFNGRGKMLKHAMLNLIVKQRSKQTQHVHQKIRLLYLDLLHQSNEETSMMVQLVSRMSYADLREATNNFSPDNLIGMGNMGTTYKGTLPNGWPLAIKKLLDTQKFEEHFITEVMTIGRFRHENILPLLGFCVEFREKLLVYKYMSNGNLYDWLHPTAENEAKFLDWTLRVQIAHGIARGLVWLHHNCNFLVVHLDLCSKCILLDKNFVPKISNFGEAMLMKSNGTHRKIGFWESNFVEEDVYRFGILLLELITGEDIGQLIDSSNTGDETLNKWVIHLTSSSSLHDFIDKSLIGRGFDDEMIEIFRVACSCVHPNPDGRPTMLEVLETVGAVDKRYGLKTVSKLNRKLQ